MVSTPYDVIVILELPVNTVLGLVAERFEKYVHPFAAFVSGTLMTRVQITLSVNFGAKNVNPSR